MIQLLLVEDEAWIRKGILKHIPFYDLGIGNVQAVQNAAEALELCKGGFVPDILLSDIRMPGMSGTEMAAMIKERNPRCKIIFISGYSDKEYLTTAIKLQVVGYIEKPIDLEVLKDTLLQAVNQIRLMKMQRRTLLHRLLFSLNTETVMPFSKKERIVVLFLLKSKDEIFGMYDVAKSLEQAMSALFRGHTGIEVLADEISTGLYAFLVLASEDADSELNKEKERDIDFGQMGKRFPGLIAENCFLLKKADESWFLSFQNVSTRDELPDMERLRYAFEKAKENLKTLAYMGWNTFVTEADAGEAESEKRLLPDFSKEYRKYLRENDADACMNLVDHYVAHLIRQRARMRHIVRNRLYQFIDLIDELRRETGREEEEEDLHQAMDEFVTFSEYADYIKEYIRMYFDKVSSDGNHFIIKKVCDYIDEHLTGVQLSIKELSDEVYLSATYLSTLFKRKMGMTISEYIMDKRVKMACELLKDPKLKQYMIARMVGYDDAKYFARIFKKRMGMKPSEYRGNLP